MNTFWKLYRKEVRFLTGPGIGLIVIAYLRILLELRIRYFDDAFAYIYGTLLLYTLIHEHLTRSSLQISMLPIQRSLRIAAKYCAVVTWAILNIPQGLIYSALKAFLSTFIPAIYWPGWADPSVIVMTVTSMTMEVIFVCALFAFGYAAALTVRSLKFLIGPSAVVAGYMIRHPMQRHLGMFLEERFPLIDAYISIGPLTGFYWQWELSYLLLTIMFLSIGMIFYERYAEV